MSESLNRSFERIEIDDLARLAVLANADLDDLFLRKGSGVYSGRCVLMCLCQGSAQHFVYGDRGVHDFDVWAFYREHPSGAFPYRRIGNVDFGPSRFGRDPDDLPRFSGRRVDVIGRSIRVDGEETGVMAVQRYLKASKTKSAGQLAMRPVVAIWPTANLGDIIWRPGGSKRKEARK
jgi:hypothetical protein